MQIRHHVVVFEEVVVPVFIGSAHLGNTRMYITRYSYSSSVYYLTLFEMTHICIK